MDESANWTDGNWTYSLQPEGRLWRFRGSFPVPGKDAIECDFGLIPGGAFIAIESLLKRAGATVL